MKQIIRITPHNIAADPDIFYWLISCMEACIVDFPVFRELPETLEFNIWGAVLNLIKTDFIHTETSFNLYPKDLHSYNDYMYISGLARIRFTKIKGGEIGIFPYDPIRDAGGEIQFIKKIMVLIFAYCALGLSITRKSYKSIFLITPLIGLMGRVIFIFIAMAERLILNLTTKT